MSSLFIVQSTSKMITLFNTFLMLSIMSNETDLKTPRMLQEEIKRQNRILCKSGTGACSSTTHQEAIGLHCSMCSFEHPLIRTFCFTCSFKAHALILDASFKALCAASETLHIIIRTHTSSIIIHKF